MARNYILILQPDGSFIATSTRHIAATGEGRTEEEALKDLEDQIAKRSTINRYSLGLAKWLHQILPRSRRETQATEEHHN